MIIRTCGIRKAEQFWGHPDWHVLSIRSVGGKIAELLPGWSNCTFVTLEDVGYVQNVVQIAKVVEALERAHSEGKNLLIHCEMGVSRSVGVAFAASEHFNVAYSNSHHGNSTVKNEVLAALRKAKEAHDAP